MYKFCQCKNGTHKINANTNKKVDVNSDKVDLESDKNSFIVNCNSKKVYLASNPPPDAGQHEHDEDLQLIAKNNNNDDPNAKVKDEKDDKKKKPKKEEDDFESIWSIFGIKSQATGIKSTKHEQMLFIIFTQSILVLLAYFF